MTRKHLVISAVNLVEGGTLAVLRDCLRAARDLLGESWRITAIVHTAAVVDVPGIEYIERPDIKRSWLARIWFEYVACRKLSHELGADFWLAMHDMTPRVATAQQAVYCHNAMCFYRIAWREVLLDPKQLAFVLLYAHLYRINLRANRAIIVQQEWIRTEFERRYGVSNVIVAHPRLGADDDASPKQSGSRFFYPSFPRVFKNFEILLRAWELLCEDPNWLADLVVTVDGSENPYARGLIARFGNLRNVRFCGRLAHAAVLAQYGESDCLVFPSRLETWGLPLSEAKQHGLAILAADLPYAHEAVGSYGSACFFSPESAEELAQRMREFVRGPSPMQPTRALPIPHPYTASWSALLDLLLDLSANVASEPDSRQIVDVE